MDDIMVKVYARRIRRGSISLADVPERIRERVRGEIEAEG
ncbi:CD1375 family protein [Eggerthellaceae bacterium 24-137]